MPIPDFDNILNIIPPHLGDPRKRGDLSPYPCTLTEVCERFAVSDKRKETLAGLLEFRRTLFDLGLSGFQWLDGSFLENIEIQEGREPGDIDVVTFVGDPADPLELKNILVPQYRALLDRKYLKATYSVDHFFVPLGTAPSQLVNHARYWYGLFAHRRDGVWKGMLTVDLSDSNDDETAISTLEGRP